MQNMVSVAQKRAQLQKRILISIYLSSVDYTVQTFFAQSSKLGQYIRDEY